MTVSSQTNNVTFVGNGSATAFPLPFRFFSNGDIFAYFIDSISGASTPMVLGTDYTLLGAGEPEVDGGALSLLTTTAPLASMRGLYVERLMPQTQQTDIVNQGEFFASTHEDVFDRLTMLIQQNAGAINRVIRVQDFDPEPAKLPSAAQRALKIMSFDIDGNPVAIDAASDSSLVLRQDLADYTDPAKGAALVSGATIYVGSVVKLEALSLGTGVAVYLTEDGRAGEFVVKTGTPPSDPQKGIYIALANGNYAERRYGGALDIQWFGALCDGTGDDSVAFQAALDFLKAIGGGEIRLPPKEVRINNTITYAGAPTGQNHINVTFSGSGPATRILHYATGALFSFSGLIHKFEAKDFNIYSKRLSTTETAAAFYFPDGNCDSSYENIEYRVAPGDNQATNRPSTFYYCGTDKLNDSVYFYTCYALDYTVKGFRFGKGSSIWIVGGRAVGSWPDHYCIGIHLTGGNGGVYLWGVDAILNGVNLYISKDSGETNREVFLTNFISDYSHVGVHITDESYVSWSDVWAASSDVACIDYSPSTDSGNAILNLQGGTIFNGGAPTGTLSGRGINLNGNGRIQCSDVVFRNNMGRAISLNNIGAENRCRFKNNEFKDNATKAGVTEQVYLAGLVDFVGNTFYAGDTKPVTIDAASISGVAIRNNEGISGKSIAPTIPASGVETTNVTGYDLDIYVREGSVTAIFVSGNPVYAFSPAAPANHKITVRSGGTYKINYVSTPNLVFITV